MTVLTDRPNATTTNTGSPSGNIHASLDDTPDADGTYVTLNDGQVIVMGFTEPTIPAGGVIKEVRLRVRIRTENGNLGYLGLTTEADGEEAVSYLELYSQNFATYTAAAAVLGPNLGPLGYQATVMPTTTPINSDTVRVSELYLDTKYVAKPTLNVTLPTGTITDDTTPPTTWTRVLDGDGGTQTRYHVKIFSAAQYGAGGFDPATSTATLNSADTASAALTKTFTTPLAEGTYRSYVRIAQTVNGVKHWSDWDYSEFTIAVLRPDPPVSVTATGEDDDARIHIEVVTTDTGDATVDLVEIEVSDDGGTTWEPLRTLLGGGLVVEAGDAAEAWDSEAPNGATRTYQVRTLHDNGDGTYAMSTWVGDSAAWTGAGFWLKHASRPDLNMTVRPQSQPSQTRAARRGVFRPLGRSDAIVVSDVRSDRSGEWVFITYTGAERAALDALLATGDSLLLQAPAGAEWDDAWLSFGDHERGRIVDKSWGQEMSESLPWDEASPPGGNLQTWPE